MGCQRCLMTLSNWSNLIKQRQQGTPHHLQQGRSGCCCCLACSWAISSQTTPSLLAVAAARGGAAYLQASWCSQTAGMLLRP